MLNRVSIDGFFAGPKGELLEWSVQDPAVDTAAHQMISPDTLILGRVTYQMFESYWPNVLKDPKAPKGARAMANELSEMNKVVFSNSLKAVTWENTILVKGDVGSEVRKLKRRKGDDITIFGSGTIVQQLVAEGLLDEFVFIVSPVILGTGKPLFQNVKKPKLALLASKKFKSGNVVLHYRLAQ